MARFLIELEHEASKEACSTAIQTLLSTGSHFLTKAEWGCSDEEHRCWITVDVDKKEDARTILPPVYRKEAKIIKLKRYTLEDFNKGIQSKQY